MLFDLVYFFNKLSIKKLKYAYKKNILKYRIEPFIVIL